MELGPRFWPAKEVTVISWGEIGGLGFWLTGCVESWEMRVKQAEVRCFRLIFLLSFGIPIVWISFTESVGRRFVPICCRLGRR